MGIRTLGLIAALIAVLLAAGCGGDGESDGTAASGEASQPAEATSGDAKAGDAASGQEVTTNSLTKAQYIKQVNDLCTQAREGRRDEINAYLSRYSDKPESVWVPKLMKEVYVPTMEAQFQEIRELGAPAGHEEEIEKIVDAFDRQVEAIAKLKNLEPNPQLDRLLDRTGRLARTYNLVECTYN